MIITHIQSPAHAADIIAQAMSKHIRIHHLIMHGRDPRATDLLKERMLNLTRSWGEGDILEHEVDAACSYLDNMHGPAILRLMHDAAAREVAAIRHS
jgi:hypothetical protein